MFHLSELVRVRNKQPEGARGFSQVVCFLPGSLWCLGLAPIWEKAPTFGGGVYVTRGLLSDLFRECFVWFFAFVFWQCASDVSPACAAVYCSPGEIPRHSNYACCPTLCNCQIDNRSRFCLWSCVIWPAVNFCRFAESPAGQ